MEWEREYGAQTLILLSFLFKVSTHGLAMLNLNNTIKSETTIPVKLFRVKQDIQKIWYRKCQDSKISQCCIKRIWYTQA